MTKDEAFARITEAGWRPLEQRGFYSHFIRAIDDTRQRNSVTVDFNKNGTINKRKLDTALEKMKTNFREESLTIDTR